MFKSITGALLAFGFAGLTWAQQIDLNKATEVDLDAIKGVGPVLTKAVMDERKKAPFKDWEDAIRRVKGLGPQKASKLSEQGVRVQGSAYALTGADQKPNAKAADAAAKSAPAKN
ncbi:MAG: helix-hairpin-helix domain-containing protein [Limnohabitans sp.]|jgi:competence protein ComEA|uniref:ComEA family DNA-binding protein n=1 Tax=Limnohabitans sp. TaxID=1907725 RepID=UPI0025D382D2|nr:helix-hairpin-helix domain-containing protein [Limnohabitans sp.]MCO4089061.1 helix-hairpin-helix domain-containing protein [Limnohabitans sp.]